MDWTEILERGGVPEPPGRVESLRRLREERKFVATIRSRSTHLVKTLRIEARHRLMNSDLAPYYGIAVLLNP